MAARAKPVQKGDEAMDGPFAHLRATPEELERLRALAPPRRSLEEWLGPPREVSEADLADLEWSLREREDGNRTG